MAREAMKPLRPKGESREPPSITNLGKTKKAITVDNFLERIVETGNSEDQVPREGEETEINLDLGVNWTQVYDDKYDLVAYFKLAPLTVIGSWARKKEDGQIWWHVSVSHRHRVPTYNELAEVKRRFIGPDRKAVMVFAEEKNHVNIHLNCLHLWCCLTADPLPEFSGLLDDGRRTI